MQYDEMFLYHRQNMGGGLGYIVRYIYSKGIFRAPVVAQFIVNVYEGCSK